MRGKTTTIGEWCAEQCGVDHDVLFDGTIVYDGLGNGCKELFWSIKRATCREIVRERFKLTTCTGAYGLFYCYNDKTEYATDGIGKETIAEAEIACITAIWEARDENKS